MPDLSTLSTEELNAELERRKALENAPPPPPTPLDNPDFSKLIETLVSCVADAARNQYWDDDIDHYVYEAAFSAVYGPAFWEWRRNQTW